MSDFDFDPVPGLPETLPKGERMLWQGSPRWWPLALTAFRVRAIALYFVLVIAGRAVYAFASGRDAVASLSYALWLLPLATLALALLTGLAWIASRTTIYTITDRRVVLRIGMALPITLNLPFAVIEGAGFARNSGGTGDLPLQLRNGDRVAYLVLWPHARPWRYSRPEPMLRSVPDAEHVAAILSEALRAHAAGEAARIVVPSNPEAAGRQGYGGIQPAMAS